jgi:hypothetical protein
MQTDLQAYFFKKFPKLYTECGENYPFTLFGFECNDGWFRLILWLSRYLQTYVDQQNEMAEKYPDTYQKVDQIKVLQVKEKFGTLRYYYRGGNEHTSAVVQFAEFISGYICEETGKTDNIGYNRKGWIKTKHVSNSSTNLKDFYFVDDQELRDLLNKVNENGDQLKLNL